VICKGRRKCADKPSGRDGLGCPISLRRSRFRLQSFRFAIPRRRIGDQRFKKMLPPNLQDNDPNDPAAQAQALQAQLSQTQQHLQAINAYAQQLEKEKEGRVIENQAKAQIAQLQEQSKQEIVRMQEATKLAVAQINASKDANQAFAERELEQYKILHGAAHEVALQAQDHQHSMEQAQQSHDQALEQGDQAAANQSALAAQQAQVSASPQEG